MRYRSLAGQSPPVDFRTALIQGIAPDGSLYVPESIPRLDASFLGSLNEKLLWDVAVEVLAPFTEGISRGDLTAIVREALDFPLPLVRLDERIHLLELFHGPTLAFKDVGARFMARTLSHVLAGEEGDITILVATSGDTGSAVAHGFFGVPRTEVFVLYPSGRISDLQERQIATLGGNVRAVEVAGNFDDCQRLVKAALAAGSARRRLTTANSINVGRLLPQIVLYAWALAQWRRGAEGQVPTVVVPSGNFGNLTAAAYAKALGIPIARLVAATNENDVVPQYFRTGRLAPRPSVATYSNAMDVGDPSNLPRIQHLYGSDLERMRADLDARAVSDHATADEIRDTHRRTGLTLDPHTAVGVAVARALEADVHAIVAATAHPAKFPNVIRTALGQPAPLPPALEGVMKREKRSVRIPPEDGALRTLLEG